MDVQTLTTLVLILLSAMIVAGRFLKMFQKSGSSGCGSCNGCSGGNSAAAIKVVPLVQLGMSMPENQTNAAANENPRRNSLFP